MLELSLKVQYRNMEDALNQSYEAFKQSETSDDRFPYELPLRLHIFCYEVWTDLLAFQRNKPEGFARVIALKALIHRLVEFNRHLDEYLIPKMLAYAEKRKRAFTEEDARSMRKRWRAMFKQLDRWKKIRNKTTGHYDPDAASVVALLEGIDLADIHRTMMSFIDYGVELTNRVTSSRY